MAFFVKNLTNPVASAHEFGIHLPTASSRDDALQKYVQAGYPVASGDVMRYLDTGINPAVLTNKVAQVAPSYSNGADPSPAPTLPPSGT